MLAAGVRAHICICTDNRVFETGMLSLGQSRNLGNSQAGPIVLALYWAADRIGGPPGPVGKAKCTETEELWNRKMAALAHRPRAGLLPAGLSGNRQGGTRGHTGPSVAAASRPGSEATVGLSFLKEATRRRHGSLSGLLLSQFRTPSGGPPLRFRFLFLQRPRAVSLYGPNLVILVP